VICPDCAGMCDRSLEAAYQKQEVEQCSDDPEDKPSSGHSLIRGLTPRGSRSTNSSKNDGENGHDDWEHERNHAQYAEHEGSDSHAVLWLSDRRCERGGHRLEFSGWTLNRGQRGRSTQQFPA